MFLDAITEHSVVDHGYSFRREKESDSNHSGFYCCQVEFDNLGVLLENQPGEMDRELEAIHFSTAAIVDKWEFMPLLEDSILFRS
ncbi:hypothetical protein TNIN_412251 [Trichonephila inaurata madagascariensis]|uniref:Uncharacterized protein n=1 Tax=Trichonephila inaurata madagascariensis TaxID=2747483 RepID=A0A8X6Y338_9ARAC|nr:hypothetical protein TNIN_412251 [Trichonephila inaurata madagascariensis]